MEFFLVENIRVGGVVSTHEKHRCMFNPFRTFNRFALFKPFNPAKSEHATVLA